MRHTYLKNNFSPARYLHQNQQKYLNNLVEQDHRAIKRRTRPMIGFKNFRCARLILGGIEIMHMICKGQMTGSAKALSPAQQFNSLLHK
ncbi:DDE-type integrase/transposase/recombinase [Robbsia andropogonis]|uniref:DDE-type integrase/transposase/recombinase n=1 Tax=Robbsia andropogonis TaxID=28092 RepID=UPI00389A641A